MKLIQVTHHQRSEFGYMIVHPQQQMCALGTLTSRDWSSSDTTRYSNRYIPISVNAAANTRDMRN